LIRDLWARLSHNAGYKALSVLLALTAWVYVQSNSVVESKLRVPVRFTFPDQLGTIEPLPSMVTLQIRGTRVAVRNAAEADARLAMDLEQLGQGAHQLDFDPLGVEGLPAGVEVVAVSPTSLRVALDELVRRRVQVVADQVGEPAPGFRVEQITLDPSVVEVRGPRAVLKDLEAVPIAPLDVSGMAADTIVDVQLQPPRAVELAEEVHARASVRVVPELEQRVFPSVPVAMWRQPDWRSGVDTVELTLEGPSGVIRGMTSEDVVAFVHLPDRPERSRYEATLGPERGLRVRVLHPGGEEVRVLSMEPMQIPVARR